MERALSQLIRLIRYRFLLVAGLLPYGLGAGIAFYSEWRFNLSLFLVGLLGLFFVLLGVEAFNEFFDWQLGTDRAFQLNPEPVTSRTFVVGLAAFGVAFIVAVFLARKLGMAIIVFSLIGFFFAFSYLGPPFKLIYRGFGELVIALSYGPLMMLGSYYLQSQRIDALPLLVSVIPAFLLFAISILNQVPDYLQDRLVGKRNICVRIGPRNVVRLYGGVQLLFYVALLAGLLSGRLPLLAWLALACLPISLVSYTTGMQTYDNPPQFLPTIRYLIIHYLLVLGILIASYILSS